jgi:hypothetical protein
VAQPPLPPEEQQRRAIVEARSRIAREQQKAVKEKEWQNPFLKLGQSGKMQRLLAWTRNRDLSVEEGIAIAKVADVARGALDEEVSADDITLYEQATQMQPGQNITTGTRQEGRNRERIMGRVKRERKRGSVLIQERLAEGPITDINEWNELVQNSYSNLTRGIGQVDARGMMPENLVNAENLDAANQPFYRQWLAREYNVTDRAQQDKFLSAARDGGAGQDVYEQFIADAEGGAWVQSPDGKFSQNMPSAATLKARRDEEARRAAAIRLGRRESRPNILNSAERELLEEAGVSESDTRIGVSLATEDRAATDAKVEKEFGKPSRATAFTFHGTAGRASITTRAMNLMRAHKSMTAEQAIGQAISEGVKAKIITGGSARDAYLVYRGAIRDEIASRNAAIIERGGEAVFEARGSAIQRLNVELVEFTDDFSPSVDARQLMASQIDEQGDIDNASQQIISDHFAGLDFTEEGYLQRGLEASSFAPSIAQRDYKEVWDAYEKVKGTLSDSYEARLRQENEADMEKKEAQDREDARRAGIANAEAANGKIVVWASENPDAAHQSFRNPENAQAWLDADDVGKQKIKQADDYQIGRELRTEKNLARIEESFTKGGYGFYVEAHNKTIEAAIAKHEGLRAQFLIDPDSVSTEEQILLKGTDVDALRRQQTYVVGRFATAKHLDPIEREELLVGMEQYINSPQSEFTFEQRQRALDVIQEQREQVAGEYVKARLDAQKEVEERKNIFDRLADFAKP